MREVLEGDPAAPSSEILRLVRLAGYTGQKSALFELVASLRAPPPRAVDELHGLPGEVSEHDLARAGGGGLVLCSRLRWSGWMHATTLHALHAEAVARALAASFHAFGGVPMVAVVAPRLPGAGAGVAPDDIDPILAQLVLTLGIGLEIGATGLAAEVEGALAEDPSRPVAALCEASNAARTPGRRRSPRTRLDDERPRLRPLRVAPEALVFRCEAMVDRRGLVVHEGEHWTMPPAAVGARAQVLLGAREVRIRAAGIEVVHARAPGWPGVD